MAVRVAVTGMGAVCGAGGTVREAWTNLLAGRSGISPVERVDTSPLPVGIAGEVKNFELSEGILSPRERGRFDRFIQFALQATDEAMRQAGLAGEGREHPPERMGVVLGVGLGGLPALETGVRTFLERGPRRVSPFFLTSVIPNMASGVVSIAFDLRGVNHTVSSACASSNHAMGVAWDEVRSGRHDVVVTGGAESTISSMGIVGFANMKALSRWNDRPAAASRPFDRERNGFVLGEGAGVLVFENLEKARARGAEVLAEVAGHGSSSDAHHITAPHAEGRGGRRCMEAAMANAGIGPGQVGYINAHATSTPLGDKARPTPSGRPSAGGPGRSPCPPPSP